MDDDEFEFVEMPAAHSRRFRKLDLLVLGLNLAVDIADAIGSNLSSAAALVAMHVNYTQDQDAFHQEAALEIEALTSAAPEEE